MSATLQRQQTEVQPAWGRPKKNDAQHDNGPIHRNIDLHFRHSVDYM